LGTYDIIVEQIPGQPVTYSAGTDKGDRLFPKLVLGGLLGATLGVLAVALAHKGTTQRVNQTVKSVGNAVKGAAESLNGPVKDVGEAAKRATEGVSDTVKDTVDAVKSTAGGVSDTVKDTMDSAKAQLKMSRYLLNQDVKTSDKQKTYILVPMENE
jgi:gas vesicle protein